MRDEDMAIKFSDLLGKTFIKVERVGVEPPYVDDRIIFHVSDTERYVMYHDQGCCEDVHIEDIDGDLDNLVGSRIVYAEEVVREDIPPINDAGLDSWRWTFYKLATAKGWVTIRWYGTSNGYYSESVDMMRELGGA